MPLPSFGVSLSMSQINAEFGRGTNLNSYRGTQYYLASSGPFNFPSGTIAYSDFYGTQLNAPTPTSSSHTIVEGGSGGNSLGYASQSFNGISGIIGSCTPVATFAGWSIAGFYIYTFKGFSTAYLIFDGDATSPGTFWTYGTYRGTTFYRANCVEPGGVYVSNDGTATDYTRWTLSQGEEPPFSGANGSGDTLVLYA